MKGRSSHALGFQQAATELDVYILKTQLKLRIVAAVPVTAVNLHCLLTKEFNGIFAFPHELSSCALSVLRRNW